MPDSQKSSKQYLINKLKRDNVSLFSQTVISLILSPKRNEELIINDNVVPVSLTGFKYQINPNDKKIRIQIKVYDINTNDNIDSIDRTSFKTYTITEDLFNEIEVNSTFDEMNFKLHS
ncbi:UNVERIFIED_CONTAM: hypothetical protein O8I53_13630 [Campylobacter lari]